ncbi:MAG: protein-L-isoaspartate(D-aspartate) O-methyltransferase [Candidatus Krumholzibacteria bacterium]|nr:protein-L-isoaspartate(D-aspartate) O-methyltransferase [Candidatus Krumholzibacteria bacterium]
MESGHHYAIARRRMVTEQLAARGINDDRVLKAFLAVPRHRFVDAAVGSRAYDDCSFPIGYDQTISQPYTIAFMIQSLGVKRLHRVLEIGTGSGYQTAILSLLARDVFSIERLAPLLKKAEAVLGGIRRGSIRVKVSDGALGWGSYAPFDRIIVSAAMQDRPVKLLEQLADGGRLIAPISESSECIVLFTKQGDSITEQRLARCSFVPLLKGAG